MSLNKKKIVYIYPSKGIGGAPLSLLYLIEQLDLKKYQPKVIFLQKSDAVDLFKLKGIDTRICSNIYYNYFGFSEVNVKRFSFKLFLKQIFSWFLNAFIIGKRILKEEKPYLVHLNSSTLSDWAVAAKLLSIPVIVHIREPIAKNHFRIGKFFLRQIYKHCTKKIIAISYDNAKRLNVLNKTEVIYNFVDFNYFDKTLKPKIQNEKTKFVLYLGGQSRRKGFENVVNSLQYLDKNITVLFAGYYYDSSKNDNLHLIKMRTSHNAKEVGLIENIPQYLADSFLLISTFSIPHFSRPIIEAGAMAKPVIATMLEGIEEMVIDGETGILVKPGNPEMLANAINKICDDEILARKLGEAGYQRAKQLFNAEKNAEATFKLYE